MSDFQAIADRVEIEASTRSGTSTPLRWRARHPCYEARTTAMPARVGANESITLAFASSLSTEFVWSYASPGNAAPLADTTSRCPAASTVGPFGFQMPPPRLVGGL